MDNNGHDEFTYKTEIKNEEITVVNFFKNKNEQANEQMIIHDKDEGETNNQEKTKEVNY